MENSPARRLFRSKIGKLLFKLIAVSSEIAKEDIKRKSILLSVFVLSLVFFVAVYETASALFNGYIFSFSSAAGYSIFFFAYFLNRRGKYMAAGLLFIFTIPLVQFLEFFLQPETFNLINILFIGLDVVFCVVLFSVRLTVVISLINITGIILTSLWIMCVVPSFSFNQVIVPLFFHIGISSLLVILILYVKKAAERQQENLRLNEIRYKGIFENSPIALGEINASQLKHHIDELKSNGIEDINSYFDKHPDELASCTGMVKIVDVNNTAVQLYEAESKKHLSENLYAIFSNERFTAFKNAVFSRMNGKLLNFHELNQKTLTGKGLHVLVHSSLPAEFKDTWERIIISVIDISDRKEMEVQLAQRADFLELVSEIQSSIASILDLNELLKKTVMVMNDVLGYYENSVWLKDGKEMVLKAASFKAVQDEIGKARLKIGLEGIVGKTAENEKIYNCPDVSKDPYYTVYAEDVKTKSECAVPIKIKDKLIGILDVQSDSLNAFKPEDEKILTTVATQLATAVENAFLYSNARIRSERLATINRIGREISTSLEIDTLLEKAYSEINALFNPDAFSIGFYNEKSGEYNCRICVDEGIRVDQKPINLKEGSAPLLEFVVARKESVRFTNLSRQKEKFPELHLWGSEEVPDSWLGVPLVKNQRIIGIMVIQSYNKNAYSKEDEEFLSIIADQIAVALDNAQLYEQVNQELEKQKLLEAQLVQAQKMEAIGRLAGGIAHDFNNILTGIIGYTDLLIADQRDEQYLQELTEIKNASRRAALLTSQLLAFSRKQVLQMKVVDLADTIAELEGMLKRILGEDIELIIEREKGSFVKVDPGRISQVVMNLAVNARDAMPKGGKLLLKTEKTILNKDYTEGAFSIRSGTYVVFTVKDSGTGMDKETVLHIFEPFFTTKERGKGSGLGLPMVYGIVKQSNGEVMVRSRKGHGTEFRIYFPYISGTGTGIRFMKNDSPVYKDKESTGGSETVLLVEDEESVRTVASRMLSVKGYTVLNAGNAAEAIDICKTREEDIKLLVTDIIMPGGMSGPDLVKYLSDIHPEMKVLYISGYTEETISHHGVLESGTAFLQKPFTSKALREKVRSLLDM